MATQPITPELQQLLNTAPRRVVLDTTRLVEKFQARFYSKMGVWATAGFYTFLDTVLRMLVGYMVHGEEDRETLMGAIIGDLYNDYGAVLDEGRFNNLALFVQELGIDLYAQLRFFQLYHPQYKMLYRYEGMLGKDAIFRLAHPVEITDACYVY